MGTMPSDEGTMASDGTWVPAFKGTMAVDGTSSGLAAGAGVYVAFSKDAPCTTAHQWKTYV